MALGVIYARMHVTMQGRKIVHSLTKICNVLATFADALVQWCTKRHEHQAVARKNQEEKENVAEVIVEDSKSESIVYLYLNED